MLQSLLSSKAVKFPYFLSDFQVCELEKIFSNIAFLLVNVQHFDLQNDPLLIDLAFFFHLLF